VLNSCGSIDTLFSGCLRGLGHFLSCKPSNHIMMMTTNLCFMSQTNRPDPLPSSWSWLLWQESPLSGLIITLFSARSRRGLGSVFVLQTFKSHHVSIHQPLLRVLNKKMETITIILVLQLEVSAVG
jgi:hypothetical protein